jgi:hypothetical protein
MTTTKIKHHCTTPVVLLHTPRKPSNSLLRKAKAAIEHQSKCNLYESGFIVSSESGTNAPAWTGYMIDVGGKTYHPIKLK